MLHYKRHNKKIVSLLIIAILCLGRWAVSRAPQQDRGAKCSYAGIIS